MPNKKHDGGSLEVVEAESFNQDEALLHYKATGVNSKGYIDPSRDQEPDIAPEFGVHPHPDMVNPKPPEAAVGSEASESPVVVPFEEKVEKAKEAHQAAQDAADAYNEAAKAGADDEDEVVEIGPEDALNLHLVPDESAKASQAAKK